MIPFSTRSKRTLTLLKNIKLPHTTRAMSTSNVIVKDFPSSTASPSKLFRFPGTSHESTLAVREVLEENDRGYDIYMKLRFQHNHFPHSALTRYALGAPPRLIHDTWKYEKPELAPLDPTDKERDVDLGKVPEEINGDNWTDERYLGFDGSYSRYLAFFHKEIERLGPIKTIEEYIFSPMANWQEKDNHPAPHMLIRLVAGVLHPFIHVGFGLEFDDRIILAEGLAEAAVHKSEILSHLFTQDWPKDLTTPGPASHLSVPPRVVPAAEDKLDTADEGREQPRQPRSGRSLLEIYSLFASSPSLKPAAYDNDSSINDKLKGALVDGRAEKMRDLVEQWSLSDEELKDGKDGWERKFEEIALLVTLLACATGRKGFEPRIDFFLMHTLTSSIFLPSFIQSLSIPNRRILLKTYILVIFHTAMSRGRPNLHPELLMSYDKSVKTPLHVHNRGETLGDSSDGETRNSWMDVVTSSLFHPDSHVPKAIRSLLHFDNLYGSLPPGQFIGSYLVGEQKNETETIKGTSNLDGTVFVRAANMVIDVMCMRDGDWDMSALGWDEAWK